MARRFPLLEKGKTMSNVDLNFLRNPAVRRGFTTIFGQLGVKSGDAWYVNTVTGAARNDGKTKDSPFATMAAAFAVVATGDVIYLRGRVVEELTTPAAALDVTIVGASTYPRAGGNEWRTGGTADTPLLIVQTPGWRFENIFFKCPEEDAPAVSLVRDDDTQWASRPSFVGCHFEQGKGAIWDTGGTDSVSIENCEFRDIDAASAVAIKSVDTAIAIPLSWTIRGCTFRENLADIAISSSFGLIADNHFLTAGSGATNKVVSTTFVGAQGGNNHVTGNWFNNTEAQIAPGSGYTGASTDLWKNHVNDQADMAVGQPA